MARAGSDELGLDPMGPNETDMFLVLKPRGPVADAPTSPRCCSSSARCWPSSRDCHFAFTQPIDMRVQEMIIGARGDVAVKIFGPDIVEAERAREQAGGDPVAASTAPRTCSRRSTKASQYLHRRDRTGWRPAASA